MRTGTESSGLTAAEALDAVRFENGGQFRWSVACRGMDPTPDGSAVFAPPDFDRGDGSIFYNAVDGDGEVYLRRFKWNSAKQAYRMSLARADGTSHSKVTQIAPSIAYERSFDGTTWADLPLSGEIPGFSSLTQPLSNQFLYIRPKTGGPMFPGQGRLSLPGAGYASITRPAWGSLTSLKILLRAAVNDLTSGSDQVLVACDGTAGATKRGWQWGISATGFMYFEYSTNGTTMTRYTASTLFDWDDGEEFETVLDFSFAGNLGYYDVNTERRSEWPVPVAETGYDWSNANIFLTEVELQAATTAAIFNNSGTNLTLGASLSGTPRYMTGEIYDVKVFANLAAPFSTLTDPAMLPSLWYKPPLT